jgi:hypothetical protein
VYNTQNHWVSRFWPWFGILNIIKPTFWKPHLFPSSGDRGQNDERDSVSETSCSLIFTITDDGPWTNSRNPVILDLWLNLSLTKGPKRVCLPPLTWRWNQIYFPQLEFRAVNKVQKHGDSKIESSLTASNQTAIFRLRAGKYAIRNFTADDWVLAGHSLQYFRQTEE